MIYKYLRKYYLLIFIVLLAFFLRIVFLNNDLFFGFEQGRDFIKIHEILSGDLTLIGPKTDIDGIFHGAFSYYIPALPFWLSGGNPYLVQLFFVSINSVAIVFLYQFVKSLFNKNAAIISSVLYAVSYSSVVYARWLSNPTLVPALTIFILYFLVRSKNKPMYLIVVFLLWSIIVHLEIVAAAALLPGIFLYIFLKKVKVQPKVIILAVFSVLIILSPYVIFNYRHDNILANGIVQYFSTEKENISRTIQFSRFLEEVVDNVYPSSRSIALFIFWLLLTIPFALKKFDRKNLFLITVFLFTGPVMYFILGVNPLRHFYIAMPVFLSIIISCAIVSLGQKRAVFGVVFLLLIFLGNLKVIYNRLPQRRPIFLYHAQHTYIGDQKRLLDYIYIDTDTKEFNYEYYSIPYWKNEAWEYLFSWYGERKYGYLPSTNKTEIFYVLIEPEEKQPLYQQDWYENMDKVSTLISSFESGRLKLEKRSRKEEGGVK